MSVTLFFFLFCFFFFFFFFFSSRRRHTRSLCDWSSDVCSSDLGFPNIPGVRYTSLYNRQLFLDYGPNLLRGKIEVHPPKQIKNGEYKILITKVDADGNDLRSEERRVGKECRSRGWTYE